MVRLQYTPPVNGSQNTPPSRRTETDSHTWDIETIGRYAESVSGEKQSDLLPNEAPLMPSVLSPATTSCAPESQGRISVNSEKGGVDNLQIGQLWLHTKAKRAAKEKEAIAEGKADTTGGLATVLQVQPPHYLPIWGLFWSGMWTVEVLHELLKACPDLAWEHSCLGFNKSAVICGHPICF